MVGEEFKVAAYWQNGNSDANTGRLSKRTRHELYIAGSRAYFGLFVGVFAAHHLRYNYEDVRHVPAIGQLSSEQVARLSGQRVVAVPVSADTDDTTVHSIRHSLRDGVPDIEDYLVESTWGNGSITDAMRAELFANAGRLYIPGSDTHVPFGVMRLVEDTAAHLS